MHTHDHITKTCTKCGENKPATADYFRARNGKLIARCRDCEVAYKRQRRREAGIPERRMTVYKDGLMMCVVCGEFYPPTSEFFQVNKSNANGLVSHCKKCRREYIRQYRQTPDQKERERNYRQRTDVKARKNASEATPQARTRQRAYRRTSPVFRRYYDSAKYKDLQSNYAHSDRGKLKARIKAHIRRGKAAELAEGFTPEDWEVALSYFKHRCAVCGRPDGLWHSLAQDHWIPVTSPNCPGTIAANIVPLCQGADGCNNSKSNKDPEEWLLIKFGKRKARNISERIQRYFQWLNQT